MDRPRRTVRRPVPLYIPDPDILLEDDSSVDSSFDPDASSNGSEYEEDSGEDSGEDSEEDSEEDSGLPNEYDMTDGFVVPDDHISLVSDAASSEGSWHTSDDDSAFSEQDLIEDLEADEG